MGGFFGAVSHQDVTLDIFFGVDYHSHLGTRRGGISEDQYNSNGDLIPGFTTSVPLAADLTDEQKKSRILTNVNFSALLAGAIHVVEVTGSLVYSY